MQFLFFLTVPYSLNMNTKMFFTLFIIDCATLLATISKNVVKIYLLSVNKLCKVYLAYRACLVFYNLQSLSYLMQTLLQLVPYRLLIFLRDYS